MFYCGAAGEGRYAHCLIDVHARRFCPLTVTHNKVTFCTTEWVHCNPECTYRATNKDLVPDCRGLLAWCLATRHCRLSLNAPTIWKRQVRDGQ